MWIVQPGRCASLPAKPLLKRRIVGQVCGQYLQRDHPFGGCIEGPPNLPHAAAAQQLYEAVPSEWRPFHFNLHGKCGSFSDTISRGPGLGAETRCISSDR
jgi:hypothetical protein